MRPDGGTPRYERAADASRTEPHLVVTLASTPLAVRAALAEMRAALARLCIGAEAAGTVELVLAEVMNNICEHAYPDAPGELVLSVWTEGETLAFQTHDDGLPMPDGRVPAGRAVRVDRPLEELPEGGFGWHLIRQFTTDLTYVRIGDRNELRFRMRRDARPIGG